MKVNISPRRLITIYVGLVLGVSPALIQQAQAASQRITRKKTASEAKPYIPKDLEDCFSQLDKTLSAEDRKMIASKTEGDLWEYHFGLGTGLRNEWGLWAHSRFAQYFEALGVDHPESMSSIIIKSYWRRLNHQNIRLEEQLADYRADVEKAKRDEEIEKERVTKVFQEIPRLMLGYTYSRDHVPVVRMPRRNRNELRARFIAPFDNGVFISAREVLDNSALDSTYKLVPYFLDDRDQKIHPIRIPEIKGILDAVVVGEWSWFLGKNKESPVLLGIRGSERRDVALPRSDEIPQLGISGDNLLLVYPKSVLRRREDDWETVYSGDIKLPWSGPPPRQYGDKIYFRDEGSGENEKRLWFLELKNAPKLTSVDEDTGLAGPSGPRWENSFSYCVTRDGTLWTTFGEGDEKKSLVCRKPDGSYGIAVINDDVQFNGGLLGEEIDREGPEMTAITSGGWKRMGELPNPDPEKSGPSISAIVEASQDELIGVGDKGLYRIAHGQITRLLAFKDTHQRIPYGKSFLQWGWDPSNVLILENDKYLISGTFGGVYFLNRYKGEWRFQALDQKLGKPLVW